MPAALLSKDTISQFDVSPPMRLLQVQALSQFGSLPAGVDLIVMRQEKMSAAKVADTAAKVFAAAPSAQAVAEAKAAADAARAAAAKAAEEAKAAEARAAANASCIFALTLLDNHLILRFGIALRLLQSILFIGTQMRQHSQDVFAIV